jgi:hypothetical protein
VRHQKERAGVGGECAFQLLDRGEVEVAGGLVEDEAVRAERNLDGELCPRSLAGRERGDLPEDVLFIQVELGEQRPSVFRPAP